MTHLEKIDKFERDIKNTKEMIKFKESRGMKTTVDEMKLKKLEQDLETANDAAATAVLMREREMEENLKITQYADLLKMKNGEVVDVQYWDQLALKLAEDFGLIKVNGNIFIESSMKLITGSDLLSMISRKLGNSNPTLDSLIAKKMTTYIEDESIYPDPTYIVVKNGRFNVKTGDFEKGNFKSINKIDVKYNKTASSKIGKDVLSRYVGTNYGFDRQLFEAIGLGMWQAKTKQAIFCNGDSNFGKSWLFDNFVYPLIGSRNVSGFTLADMNHESNSALVNKTLAYDSDISTGVIKGATIENFKKATGDGKLIAKILFKDKFEFENYATIWANCNGLPVWSDIGSGGSLDNRMNVMQFTVNVKRDFPDPTEEVQENIEEIKKWLLKESLHALHEYSKRGKVFTKTVCSEAAVIAAYKTGDTVDKFLAQFIATTVKGRKTGIDIVNVYQAYENTFQRNEINYGDAPLGKKLMWKSIGDKAENYGIETFASNGKQKMRMIGQSKVKDEGIKKFTWHDGVVYNDINGKKGSMSLSLQEFLKLATKLKGLTITYDVDAAEVERQIEENANPKEEREV